MFSKSLFKQSCKANGIMWLIITFAVCFMLSCVMLISGRGDISKTKDAIQNTIIEQETESSIEKRALNYYEISNSALQYFDSVFGEEYVAVYKEALSGGLPEDQAAQSAQMGAYKNTMEKIENEYYPGVVQSLGYTKDSTEDQEIKGVIFYTLNPMNEDGSFMFDSFYQEHGETPLHYSDLIPGMSDASHAEARDKYAMKAASVFLAGNMTKEESIQQALDTLAEYGVTRQQYDEFGFSDYTHIKSISEQVIVSYRADISYRLDNLKDGEKEDAVKEEVTAKECNSLLANLPQEVSEALDEIGQMDMYGILIGSIFYKMAGLLLPIIYMIMTSNALIAGQVDSGSMAYVLATSVKRRTVTFTQSVYLVGSLLLMFILTSVTSVICLNIVDVTTNLTWKKLLLMNAGAFLVMFALSGICFLSSCWFNRSKNAMAIGGGLSMFFLVATMLGLFGSPILPSIIRMDALDYFNYVSVITLFDPIAILDGTNGFLPKYLILLAIGLICYIIGSVHFRKKDLPL